MRSRRWAVRARLRPTPTSWPAGGVLCINCGLGVPDSTYQKNAPYMWGPLQTPEQFLLNVGDYVINRLLHRKADPCRRPGVPITQADVRDRPLRAGPAGVQRRREAGRGSREEARVRAQGASHLPAHPRQAGRAGPHDHRQAQGEEGHHRDLPRRPDHADRPHQDGHRAELLPGVDHHRHRAHRHHDPRSSLRPEAVGHAFGVSSLAVPTGQENAEGWRLHQWYFGTDPVATKTAPLIYATIQQFMLGVHMAGPEPHPRDVPRRHVQVPGERRRADRGAGELRQPRVLHAPQIGFPATRLPRGRRHGRDLVGPQDARAQTSRVWTGTGVVRYANGGRRYLPGQMPNTPDDAFKIERLGRSSTTGPCRRVIVHPTIPHPRGGAHPAQTGYAGPGFRDAGPYHRPMADVTILHNPNCSTSRHAMDAGERGAGSRSTSCST